MKAFILAASIAVLSAGTASAANVCQKSFWRVCGSEAGHPRGVEHRSGNAPAHHEPPSKPDKPDAPSKPDKPDHPRDSGHPGKDPGHPGKPGKDTGHHHEGHDHDDHHQGEEERQ